MAFVAGSPGISGVGPPYGVLNTAGNSVPGCPLAMSVNPERGPNENMYVCVPSPIVANPSPPEICWHLIAPFTFADGVWNPDGPGANVVAPTYAGSALLSRGVPSPFVDGCVIVLVGHCTRNDCA